MQDAHPKAQVTEVAGTSASPTADPPPTAPGGTDWVAATKRVRDTSDWIVKGFVALATLLIGTGPLLVHLSEVEADTGGLVAIGGALVALLGVGVVIWLASNVNLTQTTDITDLVARADPAVRSLLERLEGSARAVELYLGGQKLDLLLSERRRAVEALSSQVGALARVSAAGDIADIERLMAISKDNIARIDALLANVTGWAGYERVRARFERARPWMFAGAAAAAIGVAVWVGTLGIDSDEISPGESKDAATGAQTTQGTIGTLTWLTAGAGGRAANDLRAQLQVGKRTVAAPTCDSMGVVSEGGTGDALNPWQVSVLPRDPCPVPVRFTVDRRVATFTPFGEGDVAAASVTIDGPKRPWLPALLAGVIVGVAAVMLFRRLRHL